MKGRKFVAVVAAVAVFAGPVAGLELDVDEETRLKTELKPGERIRAEGSYESRPSFENFNLEIRVHSSQGMNGGEFYNFSGKADGEQISCRDPYSISPKTVIYECRAEDVDDDTVNYRLSFETALNVKPGDYRIRFEAGSAIVPSSGSREKTVKTTPGATKVKVDRSQVTVKSSLNSSNGTVSVTSFEPENGTPKPSENSESVGAVRVVAPEDNQGGTVTFEHNIDPDEADLDVYYWNATSGNWTDENVEDVDVNSTHVTAEVSHFSTYAAYSSPEQQSSQNDGGGTSFTSQESTDPAIKVSAGEDIVAEVGETVMFNGSYSNASGEVSLSWSFGDGTTVSLNPVNYSYAQPGTYEAVFNVTDGQESESDSLTVTVNPSQDNTGSDRPEEPETGQEQPSESEEQQDQEGRGDQEEADRPDQPATGGFLEAPSRALLVALIALISVFVYLDYSGKLELRKILKKSFQKLR